MELRAKSSSPQIGISILSTSRLSIIHSTPQQTSPSLAQTQPTQRSRDSPSSYHSTIRATIQPPSCAPDSKGKTKKKTIISRKMSTVQLPAATHRKRVVPQADLEAASILRLGEDQNTHTLTLSEARLVINKVLENKRRGGKKYEEPE